MRPTGAISSADGSGLAPRASNRMMTSSRKTADKAPPTGHAGGFPTVGRSDDDALVTAALSGSEAAAAQLFDRHWDEARRVAAAVVGDVAIAEDIAQDALIQAFSRLASYRHEARFGTWLHRIVVNRALSVLRRHRGTLPLDAASSISGPPSPPPIDPLVGRAVADLPVKQRVVVLLRYRLDLTPTEIAELLDTKVGTVNSRLSRALEQLRTRLEEPNA